MTAITETAATPVPLTVTLAEGEEAANVLSKLLKQHIDAIVEADPRKADAARKINGKLGLHSTEPEAESTLVFDGRQVVVKNGIDADVDATITGPLKLQTETLTGAESPYVAILRRRLRIGIKWRRPLFSAQTHRFLVVPASLRPPKDGA